MAAYYSNYGPNKGRHIIFRPGMVGVVHSITPKVTLPKRGTPLPPGIDRKDEFAVVDYFDENNEPQRVGLNFCNVVIAELPRNTCPDCGAPNRPDNGEQLHYVNCPHHTKWVLKRIRRRKAAKA